MGVTFNLCHLVRIFRKFHLQRSLRAFQNLRISRGGDVFSRISPVPCFIGWNDVLATYCAMNYHGSSKSKKRWFHETLKKHEKTSRRVAFLEPGRVAYDIFWCTVKRNYDLREMILAKGFVNLLKNVKTVYPAEAHFFFLQMMFSPPCFKVFVALWV